MPLGCCLLAMTAVAGKPRVWSGFFAHPPSAPLADAQLPCRLPSAPHRRWARLLSGSATPRREEAPPHPPSTPRTLVRRLRSWLGQERACVACPHFNLPSLPAHPACSPRSPTRLPRCAAAPLPSPLHCRHRGAGAGGDRGPAAPRLLPHQRHARAGVCCAVCGVYGAVCVLWWPIQGSLPKGRGGVGAPAAGLACHPQTHRAPPTAPHLSSPPSSASCTRAPCGTCAPRRAPTPAPSSTACSSAAPLCWPPWCRWAGCRLGRAGAGRMGDRGGMTAARRLWEVERPRSQSAHRLRLVAHALSLLPHAPSHAGAGRAHDVQARAAARRPDHLTTVSPVTRFRNPLHSSPSLLPCAALPCCCYASCPLLLAAAAAAALSL